MKLRQDHQLRGNPIKPGNFHATLVEFTKVKEPESVVLEKVIAAANQIDMPSFVVLFDRAVSFKKNDGNPLVLTGGDGAMGLVKLQRALIGALHKQWLKIPPNPHYVPHMTLLYDDRMIAGLVVPSVRMSVQEFVLIRSLSGQGTIWFWAAGLYPTQKQPPKNSKYG